MHINFVLESLCLLKKPHQNPFDSFEDLSIHWDRQREATLFDTMIMMFVLLQSKNLHIISRSHELKNL
jgi:hypothetical protein